MHDEIFLFLKNLGRDIKWQISKYAYKLHGIWGRAMGIAA
jgi:hypothetical protein